MRTQTATQKHNGGASPFGALLKEWRGARKLSQLDLAMDAQVSQRHVSFVESGRSHPSREMVLKLAEALEMPLRDQNTLLSAAGYAPIFRERPLDAPEMALVKDALQLMLKHHAPNPAVVVNRNWDVVMLNESMHKVFGAIMDLNEMWARVCPDEPNNILKMTFHPEGMRPFIGNWEDIAPLLLMRTRREADAVRSERLYALLDEVVAYPGMPEELALPDWESAPSPILPLEIAFDSETFHIFSMISTFGTPQDITTDELRIESFFPADERTRDMIYALANS